MNRSQQRFVNIVTDTSADILLASIAKDAMTDRLSEKRSQGYGGWHETRSSNKNINGNVEREY